MSDAAMQQSFEDWILDDDFLCTGRELGISRQTTDQNNPPPKTTDLPDRVADNGQNQDEDPGTDPPTPIARNSMKPGVDWYTGETATETILRLSNELPVIIEPNADTIVYVGPPEQAPNQDDCEYEFTNQHFGKPCLMKRETLLRTGSARLKKLLGPTSARTERKLKALGVHRRVMRPDTIKFYVDLRPMLDEDEALYMMTNLICNKDILSWHLTSKRYGIPAEHVAGRDVLNMPPKPRRRYHIEGEKGDGRPGGTGETSPLARWKTEGTSDGKSASTENEELEPEYSPLRHHFALERLLHAIVGNDPKLNSAAKVWTYFVVANYFDCATNTRINHWIITWLLSVGNSAFIQHNPEVVYKMACGMQSPDLARCSFAILVGERSLLNTINPMAGHTSSAPIKTPHGRSLTHLDDDDQNRIDHAAESLSRRVRGIFDSLVDADMEWMKSSAEYSQLDRIASLDDDDSEGIPREVVLASARDSLRNYLRRRILQFLGQTLFAATYSEEGNSDAALRKMAVYNGLEVAARVHTLTFWATLHDRGLCSVEELSEEAARKGWKAAEVRGLVVASGVPGQDPELPFVTKGDVCSAFSHLNDRTTQDRQRKPHCDPARATTGHVRQPVGNLPAVRATIIDWWNEDPDERHAHLRPARDRCDAGDSDDARGPIRSRIQSVSTLAGQKRVLPEGDRRDSFNVGEGGTLPLRLRPREPEGENDHASQFGAVVPDGEEDLFVFELEPLTEQRTTLPVRSRREEKLSTPVSGPELAAILSDVGRSRRGQFKNQSANFLPLESPDGFLEYRDDDSLSVELSPPKKQKVRTGYQTWRENDRSKPEPPDPFRILLELDREVRAMIKDHLLTPGFVADGTCDLGIILDDQDVILSLKEDEWKYLPLWAGGFDDGTGGVFMDGVEVPDAPDVTEGGFRGGLMGLMSVQNSASGSVAGSEFEDVNTEMATSTVGKASRQATDGTATASTVISLDE